MPELATDLDPAPRNMLAQTWLKDALEEHASVAAFARFAMLLLSVAAPPDFVLAAQRAGVDEIRHARACFGLARRYGARAGGAAALNLDGALPAMTLADLAALTAEEGLVGETLGALLATAQRSVSRDPLVTKELSRIEADEARHAELAWRFARWAVDQGGEPVRAAIESALESAIERTLNEPLRDYDVDIEQWHEHGRLNCAEAREVAERGIRELIRPCARALLAQSSARRQREGELDLQKFSKPTRNFSRS